MSRITLPASTQNLDNVMAFLEEQLELMECSMKVSMQVQLAVEEVFVNIANYAYGEGKEGMATILVEKVDVPSAVKVTLSDSGIPYDPLAKPDPNITLSIDEREIGGLGIFMVKKSMDDVSYEYKDGQNHLTLFKLL